MPAINSNSVWQLATLLLLWVGAGQAQAGSLVGWGSNSSGQIDVPTGDDFVSIAAGSYHSLALKSDGSIVGWGSNGHGQTNIPDGNDFVAIAAGNYFSLALKSDGSLVGWGQNYYGQTDVPDGSGFVAIAAGNSQGLGLKSDGSLVGWGQNSYGQADAPAGNDFVAIAAGSYHSLALKSDGSIVGWGQNNYGQADPPTSHDFLAIAAGGRHNLALKSDGSLVGWGHNRYGVTDIPGGNDFLAIAAGDYHSLALRSDGSLAGWGVESGDSYYYGQTCVPAGKDFAAVAAGKYHGLAIARSPIYVDAHAAGNSDGSTWTDAYNDLQEALTVATYGDEIRVAQGVYYPSALTDPCDPRSATFQLVNGVATRGGYAGLSEQDPSARNVELYETILSGDIGVPDDPNDNCYHVFYHPSGTNLDPTAILDGFTITAGNEDGPSLQGGGGMLNESSSPTLNGCTFTGNSAISTGGGMSNYSSSPTLNGCTFTGNSAISTGGGMYNYSSSPTLTGCAFTGNFANYAGGGGMYNRYFSNPTVTNCTFSANSAVSEGGGMYNWDNSSPTVIGCTFSDNSAEQGGGMSNILRSSPTLTNCTFSDNSSSVGGGLYSLESSPTLTSCTFNGNSALYGGGLFTLGLEEGQARPPAGNDYIAIGTDFNHNLALKVDGSIVGWGRDDYGQATPPTDSDYVDIAVGLFHSLARKADGSIIGWGSNYDNLGKYAGQATPPTGNGYLAIAAGGLHSLALRADGSIVAWGRDDYGQATPPAGNGYLAIAAGFYHNLALKADGSLVSWGWDYWGQCRNTPQGNDFVAIAAGRDQCLALKADGSIVGWGDDWYGQATPPDGNDYIDISAGIDHNLARKADGSIVGWGRNDYGQATPPAGNDYIAIAAGYRHSLALKTDGSIVAWPNYNLTLSNCTISGNIPDGAWIEHCDAQIEGAVEIASNDLVGNNLMLYGNGSIQIDSTVTLDLTDAHIRCDIGGPGTIQVPLESELIIEKDAQVNLCNVADHNDSGQIFCNGLLRVREDAEIRYANVHVNRASVEDNAIILNSVINAEAGSPFGQFFVEDNVLISLDRIWADGDRYLDLDPTDCNLSNIHVDIIDVNITEGTGGAKGGLFELRGAPSLLDSFSCDPNNEFFCNAAPDTIPTFNTDSWTINRLELVEGAKLNLTNRFDFQAPYDVGGDEEVLYVKHLILGPNSILNTAFQQIYFETLEMDPTAQVVNRPLLGFSLVNISFNDEIDYLTRVKHNNFRHTQKREYDRIHVERLQEVEPDIYGMMQMSTLEDKDPLSSTYRHVFNARAKGLFAKASKEEDITIEFEYLFVNDPCSDAEIIVYLSGAPQIGQNLVEMARIRPPARGRPGSIGSGEFAIFSGTLAAANLSFNRGTYVELELRGGAGTRCWINNWDPEVWCLATCGDYNLDGPVDIGDSLVLLAEFGLSLSGPSAVEKRCLDLITDGCVNMNDLLAFGEAYRLNLCPGESGSSAASSSVMSEVLRVGPEPKTQIAAAFEPLVILGKPPSSVAGSAYVPENYAYSVETDGTFGGTVEEIDGDGRLVTDNNGSVYQVDGYLGLIRHRQDRAEVVVGPRVIVYGNNLVAIGYHDDVPGALFLSDAVFHPSDSNIVYVVPVQVNPQDGNCPYMAAAKLRLAEGGNYSLVKVYGKNPTDEFYKRRQAITYNCSNDSDINIREFKYDPDVQHLCEIEIDSDGKNLFVLSAHFAASEDAVSLNNWVLVYDEATGNESELPVWLNDPNLADRDLIGPTAMVVSSFENRLYLASSADNSDSPSGLTTEVYGFSIEKTGNNVTGLTDPIRIDIACPEPNICQTYPSSCDPSLGFVSAITSMDENPATGTLYATGFTAPKFPEHEPLPDEINEIFTTPMLAVVSPHTDRGANRIIGCDLVLPLSVVWTGPTGCGVADIHHDGRVDFRDLAIVAQCWLASSNSPIWDRCEKGDLNESDTVTMVDILILSRYWLETGCSP